MDPRAPPRSGSSVHTRSGRHLGPIARGGMAPSSGIRSCAPVLPRRGAPASRSGEHRAHTEDVTQGLPQGGKDVMRFTAPPRGSFRITCGVPGHGLSGMWIRLKVDPTAKSPSWVTS
jgi:Sulfocyanin (SoxE) domain